jgi:hypothetical protein
MVKLRPRRDKLARGMHRWLISILLLALVSACTRMRTTDPPRTATEQFLHSVAAELAARSAATDALAGRDVFVDASFVTARDGPTPEQRYMVGEFRARLLESGARLINDRERAVVVVELLSGGLGVDRYDFLLGVPVAPLLAPFGVHLSPDGSAGQLDLGLRDVRQYGFAHLGFVAYFRETGEVVVDVDPAVGRSHIEKLRFIQTRARTPSNIPTADPDADR